MSWSAFNILIPFLNSEHKFYEKNPILKKPATGLSISTDCEKNLQNHTFLRLVIVFYQNWIYKYMFWLQNRGGVKKGLDLYLAIPVNIYWSYFDCYFDLYWCYFDVLFWFIVWLIVLIYVRLMSCLSDWFIASLTSFLSSSIHPNFIFRSFVCLLT